MAEGTREDRKIEFMRRAAEAYERMMKEDQEQMITFEQMENRALEVGGKLENWLIEQSVAAAASRKTYQPACCPQCHQPLVMRPPDERRVLGRAGEVILNRAQVREEPSGPGVTKPEWNEPKYGCFLTLDTKRKTYDPQPEPPAKFLDRKSVV